MRRFVAALLVLSLASSCSHAGRGFVPAVNQLRGAQSIVLHPPVYGSTNSIYHVIIIVMENRTPDNLFNGFPGADTVASGTDSNGNTIALQPVDLNAPYDISHSHATFMTEYANGNMNGFDQAPTSVFTPLPTPTPVPTPVPTPSATPVPSPSATPMPSPSATPVPSPSATPMPSPSATPAPSPSATPMPSPSATPVPSPTSGPTDTPTPTPTDTPTPTPTDTPTPAPSATPQPSPSAIPLPSPSATPMPSPSVTPVPSPSATPAPSPSAALAYGARRGGSHRLQHSPWSKSTPVQRSAVMRRTAAMPNTAAAPDAAYGYVPQSEVQPYWTMAENYSFADRMFQTNSGPSFPAHQYLISGTAATDSTNTLYALANPNGVDYAVVGGCDSASTALVRLINPLTNDVSQKTYPCFDHVTLMDQLQAAKLTWRYYQAHYGPGLWNAPDAIKHLRQSASYTWHVRAPSTQIITDIQNNNLANVSWVMPPALSSDHGGINDGSGPDFVASVVNAVGASKYWKNTAIFITWDDWGGWYDHVKPPQYNYYELGFRVPLIVVSPFARKHYVSHVQHEFGSILNFIEETFNLTCTAAPPHCGSLGFTDTRADDLEDIFDWRQTVEPYAATPQLRPLTAKEIMNADDPDDDENMP